MSSLSADLINLMLLLATDNQTLSLCHILLLQHCWPDFTVFWISNCREKAAGTEDKKYEWRPVCCFSFLPFDKCVWVNKRKHSQNSQNYSYKMTDDLMILSSWVCKADIIKPFESISYTIFECEADAVYRSTNMVKIFFFSLLHFWMDICDNSFAK